MAKINLLFSALLLIYSTAGQALSDISIFCYYEYSGWVKSESYFALLDEHDKPVLLRGDFARGVYLIDPSDYEKTASACRSQTGKKNFDFKKIMGASPRAEVMYEYYLGALSYHYPVRNNDSLGEILALGHQVFDDFPAEKDIAGSDLGASSEITKLKSKVSNLSESAPFESFVDEQSVRDFKGAEFQIYQNGSLLYTKRLDEKEQDLNLGNALEILRKALPKQLAADLGEAKIRSHLGVAFASRAQTFDFPATLFLNEFFDGKVSHVDFSIGNSGARRNTITVVNESLNLETDVKLLYTLSMREHSTQQDSIPIGVIASHREVDFNLRTGEFSNEKITLTKE